MKNYLYVKYYSPKSIPPVSNKLLVVGFLRRWFKFRLFYYIKISK